MMACDRRTSNPRQWLAIGTRVAKEKGIGHAVARSCGVLGNMSREDTVTAQCRGAMGERHHGESATEMSLKAS